MKKYVLLAVMIAFLLVGLRGVTRPAPGAFDFRAYWSANYLLLHRQNFSDPQLMLATEQQQTGWEEDFPMMTWNLPWGLALLLPFALFSYVQATWLWLFTNLTLIFGGTVLLWQMYVSRPERKGWFGLALLLAFTFSPTLVGLIAGQSNILAFGGLAFFLYAWHNARPGYAGLALVLLLVKPHLVYLTLPLLLLKGWREGKWQLWVGFIGGAALLTLLVFVFRPTFLSEYNQSVGGGNLLAWETPTLGGFVHFATGWAWVKMIALIIFPAGVMLLWPTLLTIHIDKLLASTLFVSLITAPFGWSYDFVLGLIPLLITLARLVQQSPRFEIASFMFLFMGLNTLSFYHRLTIDSEVYLFWLPWAMASLYGWGLWRLSGR